MPLDDLVVAGAHADLLAGAHHDVGPALLHTDEGDLGDHLLRVQDLSAQHDILLGTVLEAARSRQAVQQKDDMRKISAWVAIAAVPTMIAGIYGMNFDNMPELHWRLGYPFALALMLSISLALYVIFRKRDWI